MFALKTRQTPLPGRHPPSPILSNGVDDQSTTILEAKEKEKKMEKKIDEGKAPLGSRQLNLKKSFKLGIRSLLTACSKEEFCKAFPNFTNTEQERLHRLFIQVITSLHQNIEDEFESLCLETQAGPTLDYVEQHVEEQSLDLLLNEKSNIGTIVGTLSGAKRNEIHYLMTMLQKGEEQKRRLNDRLDLLKKQRQDFSVVQGVIDKFWMGIRSYETGNCNDPMIES